MVTNTPLYITIIVVLVVVMDITQIQADNKIRKLVFNTNGFGTYSFEYETSDGTYRREDGGIKSLKEGLAVRGEYGYLDPVGHHYFVRYVADANGFQPQLFDGDTRFNDRRIF